MINQFIRHSKVLDTNQIEEIIKMSMIKPHRNKEIKNIIIINKNHQKEIN